MVATNVSENAVHLLMGEEKVDSLVSFPAATAAPSRSLDAASAMGASQ